MDKTTNGHNMLWIDGDKVGLEVTKVNGFKTKEVEMQELMRNMSTHIRFY